MTRAAFAASLIISADGTSQRTIGASMPSWSCRDHVAVVRLERTDDDAVGLHEVSDRSPLGSELRIRDVPDVREATIVEPMTNCAAGAHRHGALHRDDDPAIDLRQLVDDGPHG